MKELEVFTNFLRNNGMLVTRERLEIARTACDFDNIFNADDVCKHMSRRGLPVAASTVYRNLKLLRTAGVVENAVIDFSGKSGFRKIKQQKIACRIYCIDCNKELELEDPELEQQILNLCRKHEIEESGIVVRIEGRRNCNCRKRRRKNGKNS
jgi:Fe2+ or Zn2+ uptake regulation protein